MVSRRGGVVQSGRYAGGDGELRWVGSGVGCRDGWGAVAALAWGGGGGGVVASPDGPRVATASLDGSARVWEFFTVTGGELLRLSHGAAVVAVRSVPTCARVATASFDGSARVWDAVTGGELLRLSHGAAVVAVSFSPDGARVATASFDGSARVWDATTGRMVLEERHGGPVFRVTFSPRTGRGSRPPATTGRPGCSHSSQSERVQLTHGDWVSDVGFSPDGTRVVTASYDGTAAVSDGASR